MSRSDINRSAEMEVFARVVDSGGFSAAARSLRMTPSAVSKLVGRLEARLGSRLVHRTTRKLLLTAEGQSFYQRCVEILADIAEAEHEAASGTAPRGRVRVNSNVPFGMHHLLPLVPRFVEAHPEVQLDIVLTDQVIDLLEQRADVAIRVGPLRNSQLVARKLGESKMVILGSPDYLTQRGIPKSLAELEHHRLVTFNFVRTLEGWPVREGGFIGSFPALGCVQVGDGETARQLALAGVGLTRLALFHVGPDIKAGRLQPVLEKFNPGDTEAIHAVYVGQGSHLPARIRAFIDYLAENVRIR